MARKRDSVTHLLILAPWWVSAIFAPIAYVVFSRILPGFFISTPSQRMIGLLLAGLAPYVAGMLVVISALSALRRWKVGKQIETQSSIDSLLNLHWKEFEDLIGEAFRREGFQVQESLGGGADSGIDLKIVKNGQVTLVQCKRWKGRSIPVQVVRELYGVMTHESAHAAKVVATTHFTPEAIAFAVGKPIALIDATALLLLLGSVQASGKINAAVARGDQETVALPASAASEDKKPLCPRCSATMAMRASTRGPNAGQSFWGCSKYPNCKGTRNLAPE